MPSNRDIKEMMEARKARRAVPQIDPADVVTRPEPDLMAPIQYPEPAASQSEEVGLPPAVIDEPPRLDTTGEPAPATQPAGRATGLEIDDPRTQAPPPDDMYVPKTLRVKSHRERQLRAEAYHQDILIRDIVETALDEYFKKRYRRARGAGADQK